MRFLKRFSSADGVKKNSHSHRASIPQTLMHPRSLFSKLGFIPGDHPRMLSTIECIEKELSNGEGLLHRYTSDDGLSGTEGTFFLASFWLIDALILAGKRDRAEKIFEKILSLQNHVGLFSEELNPHTKEFLGNFPQAYTHIGLINSAFNLIEKHD